MADVEPRDAGEQPQKRGLIGRLIVPVLVAVISAGIGFSVPMVFPAVLGRETSDQELAASQPAFVPFGQIVVNLNEGRMNRYLRLSITLQISGGKQVEQEVAKTIELKKSIMTSWLLGYLADMTMDEIRGTAGQNRLRREIHDHFNWIVFPEGEGQIDDVLFEEFNVQ